MLCGVEGEPGISCPPSTPGCIRDRRDLYVCSVVLGSLAATSPEAFAAWVSFEPECVGQLPCVFSLSGCRAHGRAPVKGDCVRVIAGAWQKLPDGRWGLSVSSFTVISSVKGLLPTMIAQLHVISTFESSEIGIFLQVRLLQKGQLYRIPQHGNEQEFLICDRQGSVLRGAASGDAHKATLMKMEVGKVYSIRNFFLRRHPCSGKDLQIVCTNKMQITEINPDDGAIPKARPVKIIPIKDIHAGTHWCDISGVIIDSGELKEMTTESGRSFFSRTIVIADRSGHRRLTLLRHLITMKPHKGAIVCAAGCLNYGSGSEDKVLITDDLSDIFQIQAEGSAKLAEILSDEQTNERELDGLIHEERVEIVQRSTEQVHWEVLHELGESDPLEDYPDANEDERKRDEANREEYEEYVRQVVAVEDGTEAWKSLKAERLQKTAVTFKVPKNYEVVPSPEDLADQAHEEILSQEKKEAEEEESLQEGMAALLQQEQEQLASEPREYYVVDVDPNNDDQAHDAMLQDQQEEAYQHAQQLLQQDEEVANDIDQEAEQADIESKENSLFSITAGDMQAILDS